MIPPFAPSGNLPPGIHDAAWAEVVAALGRSPRRRAILSSVEPALRALAQAGCRTVYLGGSFASREPCPRDADLLWDPEGVDRAALAREASALADPSPPGRRRQKALYGSEFIPLDTPRDGPSFLEFFQTDKRTGRPRGIVRLDPRTVPGDPSGRASGARGFASAHRVADEEGERMDDELRETGAGDLEGGDPKDGKDGHGKDGHDHHRHCPPGTFPHDYQQGETFWILAQRYHTTVEAIERANPHLDPYNLQPGMVICIPEHHHHDHDGHDGWDREDGAPG